MNRPALSAVSVRGAARPGPVTLALSTMAPVMNSRGSLDAAWAGATGTSVATATVTARASPRARETRVFTDRLGRGGSDGRVTLRGGRGGLGPPLPPSFTHVHVASARWLPL